MVPTSRTTPHTPPHTVNEAYGDAARQLSEAGVDTARLDARLLVGRALGGGAERVLAEGPRPMTEAEAEALQRLLARRLSHEPMSHILGEKEFWSLTFKVTAATLAPRPDTETLVEAVLDHWGEGGNASVLDLGTGTGCILLALLSERPGAFGIGLDASTDALAVAAENAQALGFCGRTRFVHGDWAAADFAPPGDAPFDVVVSNPPYIPLADMESLDADVRDFEPHEALVAGADGLDAYRAIVKRLPQLLVPGGLVGFEVGQGQDEAVAAMLAQAGFAVLERRRDLGAIPRAVIARQGGE